MAMTLNIDVTENPFTHRVDIQSRRRFNFAAKGLRDIGKPCVTDKWTKNGFECIAEYYLCGTVYLRTKRLSNRDEKNFFSLPVASANGGWFISTKNGIRGPCPLDEVIAVSKGPSSIVASEFDDEECTRCKWSEHDWNASDMWNPPCLGGIAYCVECYLHVPFAPDCLKESEVKFLTEGTCNHENWHFNNTECNGVYLRVATCESCNLCISK